jgi:hypothetical protein
LTSNTCVAVLEYRHSTAQRIGRTFAAQTGMEPVEGARGRDVVTPGGEPR